MHKPLPILLMLICCFTALPAWSDITDRINTLRTRGCGSQPAVSTKLRASSELDKVARQWSQGGRLREALTRIGYRATNSASMQVEGAIDDNAIVKVLAGHYCDSIANPEFTEIGVFRQRRDIYIVVAKPFAVPTARDAQAVGQRVLTLVNEARSRPRRCGSTSFQPAPPLTLSATLTQAASKHAQDMATHSRFEHRGSDGSTAAQRVSRAGYQWRNVAENIAAGASTAEQVVNGWLKSPGHCVNIMGPQYTQMGIAYATNTKSDSGIYWAQVFARPL